MTEQKIVNVLEQGREDAAQGCKNGVNVGVSKERRPGPPKRKTARRENTGGRLEGKAATHSMGEGDGPKAIRYIQFGEVKGRTVAGSKQGLELGQGKGRRFVQKGLGKGVEKTQVANEAGLNSGLVCKKGGGAERVRGLREERGVTKAVKEDGMASRDGAG